MGISLFEILELMSAAKVRINSREVHSTGTIEYDLKVPGTRDCWLLCETGEVDGTVKRP